MAKKKTSFMAIYFKELTVEYFGLSKQFTVPKFTISQSEAVSTVLIFCDKKIPDLIWF